MFAQHLLWHASWVGPFEKTHDAAGSWSGITNNASTTVNRMAAVFRISLGLAQERPRVERRRPANPSLPNRKPADEKPAGHSLLFVVLTALPAFSLYGRNPEVRLL